MKGNLPELRRGKLKHLLKEQRFIRAIEASNGLTGLIAEKTVVDSKGFDAMWFSSFCHSMLKGKPDNEVVDFSSRLRTVEEIFSVTTKPLIFDGDTGGRTEHFVNNICELERIGVSSVVIEDKTGLKQNSLLGSAQILEKKEVFADKIRQGKRALQTDEFMIFARLEGFIAGKDLSYVADCADAYIDAGADGIMIHSGKNDGREIMEFLHLIKKRYAEIPVMLVPTAYPQFTEGQLLDAGADIVVYANHLLRSAYKSMLQTAREILAVECALNVSNTACASMKDIIEIIGDEND